MVSKRDQIIQLRTENPILRLSQIADQVGVRKSYAHKVLSKAELPTKSVLIAKKNLPKRIVCKQCGLDVSAESHPVERRTHLHEDCRYDYNRILVACKFCRRPFRRHRSKLLRSQSKYIYCSKPCLYKARREAPFKNVKD